MATIFKSGGQTEWRIQDFFLKQGEGHMWMQTLSAIPGAIFFRLIYSTYFILKNLAAKGVCVCVFKQATEVP
jgi:hypothetical protein